MPAFPLPSRPSQDYHTDGLRFGADRDDGRKHAACDLVASKGTPIYAVANGVVARAAYPFYPGTSALEIDHGGVLVRYAEIGAAVHRLTKGTQVSEGQLIAHVGKMHVDAMLYFEM